MRSCVCLEKMQLREIFGEPDDDVEFTHIIAQMVQRLGSQVYPYVLITNHSSGCAHHTIWFPIEQ
jgi:hypothetical protein